VDEDHGEKILRIFNHGTSKTKSIPKDACGFEFGIKILRCPLIAGAGECADHPLLVALTVIPGDDHRHSGGSWLFDIAPDHIACDEHGSSWAGIADITRNIDPHRDRVARLDGDIKLETDPAFGDIEDMPLGFKGGLVWVHAHACAGVARVDSESLELATVDLMGGHGKLLV